MIGNGDGMTIESLAMVKAWDAHDGCSIDKSGLTEACSAYHKAMITATPGLKFHEKDGTVRSATWKDV